MTREEAINILHGIRADNLNLDVLYTKDKYEALGMAIEALEQEQSVEECANCEYVLASDEEEPCKTCSHNYVDKWTPKKPSILDKIREEIRERALRFDEDGARGMICAIEIIDKYREGGEDGTT